jgi:DUF971 family protein
MQQGTKHWPTEIRLAERGRKLVVTFEAQRFELTAEYLRVSSPSAEVRGHSAAERKIVAGKADVAITDVVPTGNYAVRLVFDDHHETGIYTWDYLYELGDRHGEKWAAHLGELAAHGLKREG